MTKRSNDIMMQAIKGEGFEGRHQRGQMYDRINCYTGKAKRGFTLQRTQISEDPVVIKSTHAKDRWDYRPDKECEDHDEQHGIKEYLMSKLTKLKADETLVRLFQRQSVRGKAKKTLEAYFERSNDE